MDNMTKELPFRISAGDVGWVLLCNGCCKTLTDDVLDLDNPVGYLTSSISTARAVAPWSRAYL